MAVNDDDIDFIEDDSRKWFRKEDNSGLHERHIMVSLAILQELKTMNAHFNDLSKRMDALEERMDPHVRKDKPSLKLDKGP